MNHLTSIGFRGIPHRSHWSVNVVASLGFVEQILSSSSIDKKYGSENIETGELFITLLFEQSFPSTKARLGCLRLGL